MLRLSAPMGSTLPPRTREPERAGKWTQRLPFHSAASADRDALPPGAKLIHFVRHAQGYHNVDPRPIHERAADARLTPAGEAQCAALAEATAGLSPELIVASPLTRTLQTATLVFRSQLGQRASAPPLIACEYARETVNYLCDCRR